MQHRAPAAVDPFTHTGVDQKQHPENLEHLARLSHGAIRKLDLRRNVAFHDMFHAKSCRVGAQELFLAALRKAGVNPGLPVFYVETRLQNRAIADKLLAREAVLHDARLQIGGELRQAASAATPGM